MGLGYTPHVPGLLSDESSLSNPAHLDPSEKFMEKLRLRKEANKAMIEADTDFRLRRTLLRKYMGQPLVLQPGDLCYYWRDTPAGSTAKLKWRGPATIIMRKQGQHGHHTDIYWIVHRTVLLHAAPEHVKAATPAVQDLTERLRDPLDTTKQSLSNIRGRDVTQYIDLPKSNKRRRDKVATDEERRDEVATDEEEDEHDKDMQQFPGQELPPDRWNVSENGRLWTRVHNIPRRKLYVPEPTADVRTHPLQPERATDVRRGHPNPKHIRIRDE